jgi:hypothetical protein
MQDRIERLEQELRQSHGPESNGMEYITIDVVYDRTVIDPKTEERRRVPVPATYDDAIPYQDWGDGRMVRVRHPKENRGGMGE